jgi:hypothetical protein
MKFKALRKKVEPKEFVTIDTLDKVMIMYTGELPKPQPLTATMEGLKEYYKGCTPLPDQITLDDLELIEFELYETNTVGADIRNKLTPPLNLVSLLKIYFTETGDRVFDENSKAKILPFIKKEMENAEKSIKYIANLL